MGIIGFSVVVGFCHPGVLTLNLVGQHFDIRPTLGDGETDQLGP